VSVLIWHATPFLEDMLFTHADYPALVFCQDIRVIWQPEESLSIDF